MHTSSACSCSFHLQYTLVVEQKEKESKGLASTSQLLEISFLHPIRPNKSGAFTTAPLPARHCHCRRRRWRGATIVRGAIQVGTRAAAAEYSKERLCDVFPKKLGKPTGSEQRGLQSRAESPSSSSVWKPTVHANSPFYYPFFFQTAIPTTTTAERHDLTRVTLIWTKKFWISTLNYVSDLLRISSWVP